MLSQIGAFAVALLGSSITPMSAPSRSSSFSVADLRCESLPEPNCVDRVDPRLSWIVQTSLPNWTQNGYRIIVSSSRDGLAKGEGDLWDSGKVESAETSQIYYSGTSPRSNQECYWKVEVWPSASAPGVWSKPAKWEMGLVSPEDWKGAQWIGNGKAGPAPYLRKDIAIHGKVKRARLFACGLGYAELHLNGSRLGENVERDPGYTNFDKRVLYVAHDVTKQLHEGKNTLGAILGTGWYDVHDLATWRFQNAPWRDRPKLLLSLVVEYGDGHQEVFGSDPSWKTATGPILFDGIYTGEIYDARRAVAGWDTPRFDDRDWAAASVLASPKGQLAARLCPPVEITQSIVPKSIAEPKPGVFIVDFGQDISGHAQIKVAAPAGTAIKMRYSERLGKDGMIERGEIERFMTKTHPPQPFQTDEYICSGVGTEEWEQIFSYSGFRYMEVTGFPGKPSVDNFRGRFAHTALESAGTFSCSNELLNKIQAATRQSYFSNAQSILTDCPQREKNGWTGDAHLAAEAGLMNFQSSSLYEKWLNDLADDQAEDGKLSLIIPSGGWGSGMFNPAWDSTYPIIVNDLYRYTGNRDVILRHYEHVKRYVDALRTQTEKGTIPFDSLGDWLPWSTETPSQLTSTAFLYLDESLVSQFAARCGKSEDAALYARLAAETKEAFNEKFYDPATKTYANGSQAALSTSIFFGLVPDDRKAATFAALVANVEKQGHIDTGIIGAKNVLRVLSEGGRTDLAYRLVARKEQPGWGWWIEQGATTLWEDWKGESSLNHIMFGDVSNWFFQWIAGIGLDPAQPGFKHIIIRPQPVGDLTWAKGSYLCPHGLIESSWNVEGKKFSLNVTIPPNTTATVLLPGEPEKGTHATAEIGAGSYKFSSKLP